MPITRFSKVAVLLLAALLITLSPPASAEVEEIRIAQQFGLAYLPLMVMEDRNLIEKHAKKAGLDEVTVEWLQFSGGNVMNNALISGSLDFAAAGVGPLLTIWDRTKGSLDVRGVASLGSMPLYLVSINPDVNSIRDFTSEDRIALPAVRTSIQAVTLQMAAAEEFGEENYQQLDKFTVSMRHPDALAALLSGGAGITAHFANAPFQEREIKKAGATLVLSSYEVLGGPTTLNSVYTTKAFRDSNPKAYNAVLAALQEAMDIINSDKRQAAELYVESTGSTLSPEFIHNILSSEDFIFTTMPQRVMNYAEFMHEVGSLTNMPESWKDIYFEEIHAKDGG